LPRYASFGEALSSPRSKSAFPCLSKPEASTCCFGGAGCHVTAVRVGASTWWYIGLADRSVRRRLQNHISHKGSEWTHFSVYEVWDNIRRDEIAEL